MNKTVFTVLKATAGILVLLVLVWMVNGWLADYRTEAGKRPATGAQSPAAEEGSGAASSAQASSGATVVVLVDELALREEPDAKAKSIASLKKDDKLVVVKQEGKWYQVKTPEGATGWVSASPSYTLIQSK